MTQTKRFEQDHIWIFSILVAFIAITLLYISNMVLFKPVNRLDYDYNRILAYLIPLIFVFSVCLFTGNWNKIKLYKKGIGTGILFGWLIIADGIYGFISSYISFDKSSISFPGLQKIINFTIVMILVGLFEEVLCRGVILNNMLMKWGYTKRGIIKSVIFSSLIFGFSHLVNLIIYPNLIISTYTQVVYTFLTGILFACIYIRCKNIMAVFILHAIYDWMGLVSDIYHTSAVAAATVDIPVVSGLITGALYIPFALVGFFLIRKTTAVDRPQFVASN